jgi:membrane associated rhomboid family serine protease
MDEAPRAAAELEAYELENRDWPPPQPGAEPIPAPYPRDTTTLWAIGLIILVYVGYGPYHSDTPLLRAAAADAGRIMAGDWWRVVTAMAVHGDLAHLAGNVVAVSLLGYAVCALLGGGAGWTLLLAAGAAANYCTALLNRERHVSFGASTVSFAAIGILVALQAVRSTPSLRSLKSLWSRTWIPVAAGIAVLAVLGTAPGSDVIGHAIALGAGAVLALPAALARADRLSVPVQWSLRLACLAGVIAAWHAAVRAALAG